MLSIKKLIKKSFRLPMDIFLRFLPDDVFLKCIYFIKMGKKLNLDQPKTFTEKIQWLKLYYRNPNYTTLVDKYEVRKYISQKIGDKYLIPILGVYNSFDEINLNELPEKFVLKCTHDSGGIVICKDKRFLNIKEARKKINRSLKRNYYYTWREWPYKNVRPRIICEKYLVDESEVELKDYKFFCFNGSPELLFVASNRGIDTRFDFFDLDFKPIPITKNHYKNSNKHIKKPAGFDEMIRLSKILSQGMPHVRVDFYDVNGKVYFGEFTFYHFSGLEKFEPEDYDRKIGDLLKMPDQISN